MLSNAYFLAKIGADTAENEPAKNLQNFAKFAKFANFADPYTPSGVPRATQQSGSARRIAGMPPTCWAVTCAMKEHLPAALLPCMAFCWATPA